MPVTMKNGSFELPRAMDSKNFDFFGLAIGSSSFAFTDLTFSTVTARDRFSTLFEPELVKPSTINLLY